jgi:hypothetical protein
MEKDSMKKLIIGFLAVCTLGACDANGGAGMEGSPLWNIRHMNSDTRIAYFTEKCTKYGYERGTDAMRDCVAEEMRDND